MKQYIKGAILGFLAACILSAIPSLADTAEMIFNSVRINVGGVDKMQWGEEIELVDGTTTPSSILYNGTTYLPLRKISQLLGNYVLWNGDTSTVTIRSNAGEKTELATKPDKNGNVWTYSTYTDGECYYLEVADKARGYERVYLMASDSVRVTDNEIYFVKIVTEREIITSEVEITKLVFDNDENSQDGEIIEVLPNVITNSVIFDGDYLIFSCYSSGYESSYLNKGIRVINYMNDNDSIYPLILPTWDIYTISSVTDSTDTSVTINFERSRDSKDHWTGMVVFDKTTNTFGQIARISY